MDPEEGQVWEEFPTTRQSTERKHRRLEPGEGGSRPRLHEEQCGVGPPQRSRDNRPIMDCESEGSRGPRRGRDRGGANLYSLARHTGEQEGEKGAREGARQLQGPGRTYAPRRTSAQRREPLRSVRGGDLPCEGAGRGSSAAVEEGDEDQLSQLHPYRGLS